MFLWSSCLGILHPRCSQDSKSLGCLLVPQPTASRDFGSFKKGAQKQFICPVLGKQHYHTDLWQHMVKEQAMTHTGKSKALQHVL